MVKHYKSVYELAIDLSTHAHTLMEYALRGLENGLCGPEGIKDARRISHGRRNQILVGICLSSATDIANSVCLIWGKRDRKLTMYLKEIEKGCAKAYALAANMGYDIKPTRTEGNEQQ